MIPKQKVILVIRDGWGYRASKKNNAVKQAGTPHTDYLMKHYPNVLINASGEAVGLPKGYQGNSEVGHMTIGSGRIIWQSMMRINKSIQDGSFFKNHVLLEAINNCKKHHSCLHIMGILQSEGVHSHESHLYALLELCKTQDFKDVHIHVFTDGRDSPVHDALKHIKKLEKVMRKLRTGQIMSISGRYYAMDRDKRWDRTKKAYDAIINAKVDQPEHKFVDAVECIHSLYRNHQTDEFIIPQIKKGYGGVNKNDSIIFFNFRTDRPRQLTQAIVEKKFIGWKRVPLDVFYVAMTEYYKPMNAHVVFKETSIENRLGQIISRNNLHQLRISETEKYAHVTFFFNGQVEKPDKNENRILVHSPKVATYDLKPEMSAYEVTRKLISEIDTAKYDFIVVNLVNGDMVGHTGVIKACHKAVRTVDECLDLIVEHGLKKDYALLVFADHGNIEDQTPKWRTSHTTNPVPFILVSNDERLRRAKLKKGAGLSDIAPTVLHLMGIEKPEEMTGKSILKNY